MLVGSIIFDFNVMSLRRKFPLWELPVFTCPAIIEIEASISLVFVSYFETSSNLNALLLLLLLLLLLTAVELSCGASSPYTSRDEANKNEFT